MHEQNHAGFLLVRREGDAGGWDSAHRRDFKLGAERAWVEAGELVEGEPDLLRSHPNVIAAQGSADPVPCGEEALWNQRGCGEQRSLLPPPGCGVGSHRTL